MTSGWTGATVLASACDPSRDSDTLHQDGREVQRCRLVVVLLQGGVVAGAVLFQAFGLAGTLLARVTTVPAVGLAARHAAPPVSSAGSVRDFVPREDRPSVSVPKESDRPYVVPPVVLPAAEQVKVVVAGALAQAGSSPSSRADSGVTPAPHLAQRPGLRSARRVNIGRRRPPSARSPVLDSVRRCNGWGRESGEFFRYAPVAPMSSSPRAIRMTSVRISSHPDGLPDRRGGWVQRRAISRRCQRRNVSGPTSQR